MTEAVAQKFEQLMSEAGLTDSAQLLLQLQLGREPRWVVTHHGFTLVHFACRHGWLDFAKSLIQEHSCDPKSMTWEARSGGISPLHRAAQNGHVEIVSYLVNEQRCRPDCVDYLQQTPLHWVCGEKSKCPREKAKEVVSFLVTIAKCDVNKTDGNVNSAFFLACKRGDAEIAEILFCEGHCDVRNFRNERDTVLHVACRENHTGDVVKFLLEKTAIDPNSKYDGGTPLHLACESESRCKAQLLVRDPRCNPLDKKSNGDTALHVACGCKARTDDVTKLLLEETKIDPNAKNRSGDTPLHLACRNRKLQVVQLLVRDARCNALEKNKDGDTALHVASYQQGGDDVTEFLLKEPKIDPNAKNRSGDTLLHLACRNLKLQVVRLLVRDARCKALEKNEKGDTALHVACRQEDGAEISELLLNETKINPNSKNEAGSTPLHLACKNNSHKAVQHLVCDPRCNPLENNSRGDTALHAVCSTAVAKYLLEETKIDPNAKNESGNTPLHLACRKEHVELVQLFVSDPRCNPFEKNNYDDTALHTACRKNRNDCVAKFLLEETTIDPNAKNQYGDTPLHSACRDNNFKLVQLLVRDPRCNPLERNNVGDTALHISCRGKRPEYIATYLLKETKIDPNAKNNDGECPLDMAPSQNLIRVLIRHGANPQDVYKTHGKILGKHSSKKPLQIPVKLFMVGNPSAGKSTLTKALQKEMTRFVSLVTRSKPVAGVDEKTAGIVPHEYESNTYGLVTLYDFAGQREFYSSHAAVLQNAIQASTPIFLLVLDLSESDEDTKRNVLYWLSFLENQCTTVTSKPHVIVIGSHADILKSRGEDAKHKANFITILVTTSQFTSLEFIGFVAMDCKYADSAGMRELHRGLKSSCDSVRKQATISFNTHCFLVYLLDNFRDVSAVTIEQILNKIPLVSSAQEITSFLPQTATKIGELCDQLNDRGHLLVLKNSTAIKDSWVIINRTALLAEVNGTIFAPEGFKEHIQLASSTGLVPLSNIAKYFSEHDLQMLVGFLSHLEFCHEILDSQILGLINQEQEASSNATSDVQGERYFFFPGLVTLEVPNTVWKPQPQFSYHCGWILQCSRPEQFFDPRFLQVLLLRLAFSFAFAKPPSDDIPSLQRKCCIWKNGIYWGDGYGVETLVEVAEQNRVAVLMRCPDVKSECLQLRSLLIQKVLAAAREFCSKVSTVESFINPSEVTQYPLKPISQLTLYDMTTVATAVAKSMPSVVDDTGTPVSLDDLLSFESYADLGEHVLQQLFDEKGPKYKKNVSNLLVYDIAKQIPHKKEIIKRLFKVDPYQLAERMSNASFTNDEHEIIRILDIWKETNNATFKSLREKLDQFSVFAGRNPLGIAGASGQGAAGQPQLTTSETDVDHEAL